MANRRVLVKRRKAAKNIHKITRTMQLIATARFQAAHNWVAASKPYLEKLARLAAAAGAAGGFDHPLTSSRDESLPTVLMVLTSNRGLCGAYNANVLRAAAEFLEQRGAAGGQTELRVVGKKGVNYFRYAGREMAARVTDMAEAPEQERVRGMADELMARFVAGEIGAVQVAYMKFLSAGRQEPAVTRLLPLTTEELAADGAHATVEYEFSPEPGELLDELLPMTVRARLYESFTDAAVSEQVARMVAMKAATDAAEDMIRNLTLKYNRARQTQITMELLDIVGGAQALS